VEGGGRSAAPLALEAVGTDTEKPQWSFTETLE